MKKLLIIMVMTINIWSLQAQQIQTFTENFDSAFKYINRTNAQTGILYERVLSIAGLTLFNSNIATVDTNDFERFKQGYHELYTASFLPSSLPYNVDSLENIIKARTNKVDIGLIHFKFNTLDTSILSQKLFLDIDSNLREDTTVLTSLYSENMVFMASPFVKTIYNSNVNFYLSDTFYFENTNNTITQIDIDFDDGLGFRTVNFNSTLSISYLQDGEKIIRVRAILNSGDTLGAFSRINIDLLPQNSNKPSNYPYYDDNTIYAQIDLSNNYSSGNFLKGTGNIRIYYANAEKELLNPILIVDGFDPGNCRHIEYYKNPDDEDEEGYSIWELLYYKDENNDSIHIGNKLINELGYDLIILDFPDGGGYIEQNAMVCIEVINEINRLLTQSGSKKEIVIIGPSMGGQITRYALAYMEQHPNDPNTNNGKHNCRLWVSFDSPHQGANISMGSQAFIQYFKGVSKDVKKTWENTLNCPAARQMLIYQKDNTNSIFNPYYNSLRNLGYPENLRKIAVANGSTTPNGYAKQLAIKVVFPYVLYNIDARIMLSPSYGEMNEVFKVTQVIIPTLLIPFPPLILKNSFSVPSPNNFCSIDASPGCSYNTFQQIKQKLKGKGAITNLYIENHCFMPTTSVLDISGNMDYCTDFSNQDLVAEGKTPFNSYWFPSDENMYHVTFSKNLTDWLINEIETFIQGEKTIPMCDIQSYSVHLPTGQENTDITWYCSENLKIVSGRYSNNVQIQAIDDGEAWIYATANNLTHAKQLGKFFITITQSDEYQYAPLLISGVQEWPDIPLKLFGTLNIFSGTTLTIKNTLYCSPHSKIVIYPGAKLIVDGGILTNSCDGVLWQGIEVLGNPSLSQDLNNTNQGILILQNEAVIENAECGVLLGKNIPAFIVNFQNQIISFPEEYNGAMAWSWYGGGIVSAENSSFINNKQSVNFQSYTSFDNNGFEKDNLSAFINCSFIVNNDAIFIVNNGESQVSMYGVKGVKFYGCTFTDMQTKSSLNNYGIGIYSNSAGVRINDNNNFLCPSPYYTIPCLFSGYATAIMIKNSNTRPVNIYNTQFSYNQTSLKTSYSYALTLQMCNVFNSSYGYFPSIYGLILDKCDMYSVENNIFHGAGIGILIDGNIVNNNQIKNNTFYDMCVACDVEGIQAGDASSIPHVGLKFLCNLFYNNDEDIHISGKICQRQGYFIDNSKYLATGNQFGSPISTMNFNNCGSDYIGYYFNSGKGNHDPIYYNPTFFWKQGIAEDKCIGSGYIGENYYFGRSYYSLSELNDMYISVHGMYDGLKVEYDNLYGNIPILMVINQYGLPVVSGLVPQFDLYAELTELKDSLANICQNAIHVLLSYSDLDKSQYNTWLYRCETIDADYKLAESYFNDNNIIQMNLQLDSILTKYTSCDAVENMQFKLCMNYLNQWSLNNDSVFISQGAFDTLTYIASGNNRASLKAESILEGFGKEIVPHWEPDRCNWWVIGNAPSGNKNETSVKETKISLKQEMILMPNPASHELTVDNGQINIKEIYIYDVVGKEVKHFSINNTKSTLIISDLVPGVYVIKAKTETGMETKKFIKD